MVEGSAACVAGRSSDWPLSGGLSDRERMGRARTGVYGQEAARRTALARAGSRIPAGVARRRATVRGRFPSDVGVCRSGSGCLACSKTTRAPGTIPGGCHSGNPMESTRATEATTRPTESRCVGSIIVSGSKEGGRVRPDRTHPVSAFSKPTRQRASIALRSGTCLQRRRSSSRRRAGISRPSSVRPPA